MKKVLIRGSAFLAVIIYSSLALAEDKTKEGLTELIISADPFQHNLVEHTSPASVLRKEDLIRRSETTIGETISKEPGVHSTYFGPGASRPVVRGQAADRVRVLSNGIGTLDVSNASEDHAVTTNPLAAESVEILRGPETLLYGSSAIGGIVNVTDNGIPEQPIGKPLTGEVDLKLGTAADELSGTVKLEGQAGSFNWHLDYFHQDTDDVDIPGFAESAALRALEEAEEAEEEEEGDFEEHGEEEEEEGVTIDLQQIRVDFRGAVNDVSDAIDSLRFKLGLSNYEHTEFEGQETGTVFDNDAAEARLELIHKPINGFRGVVGLQGQYSDFSAIGEEAFIPPVETLSPAIFLFEEYELNERIKLQAGGRYEHVDYDVEDGRSESFDPLSFSAGLVWDFNGTGDYTAGLSFAYTQRAPSTTELFADGEHAARQIFELGDETLGNERSKGIDLTLNRNTGLVTGSLNFFIQDYDRFINLDGTGEEEDGLPVFKYESIPALFWGFETKAVLHLHKALDLWANDLNLGVQVDHVRATSEVDDSDLPRIPPFRTIVSLEHGYKNLIESRVEGVFVANQSNISDSELPTDAYQLLNADVQYNLLATEDYSVGLYVKASNLTAEEARVHSSFLKDLAPLPGRNFLFGIRGTF
jgi:iron complex outermembrane receptor protein